MRKIYPIILIISMNLFGAQTKTTLNVTNEDVQKTLSKSEEWKKELSILMKNKDTKIDNKKYLDMIDTGKDGTFMGKKLPTMKLPERSFETIEDPLKRAELVDKKLIEKEYKDISKKSENLAKLYKFLATYGKQPEKNGNLENEKELFNLIEKGDLKLTSKKVKESESKIKPINHFLKINSKQDTFL